MAKRQERKPITGGCAVDQNNLIVGAWLKEGRPLSFEFNEMCQIRKSSWPAIPDIQESQKMPLLVKDALIDFSMEGRVSYGYFGRTDSGMTSIMRASGQYFNPVERITMGETSHEIAFTDPPDHKIERKVLTMTDICKALNRNNPDRIIIGEIRGEEVQAALLASSSTSVLLLKHNVQK